MAALVTTVLCVLAVSHVWIAHGQEAPTQNGGGTGTSITLPNTDVCGKRGGRFKRIVGGSDAEPGMFPWIAALGYRYWEVVSHGEDVLTMSWLCAGSLVTDRHLVTAAQCIVSAPSHYVLSVARLGVLDINDTDATGTETDYEVDTLTAHPGFSFPRMLNDIAIVRLKNIVTFSRLIQPICLPTLDEFRTKNFTGSAAYIAGWGRTSFAGETSTRLQQTEVRVWDQDKCKAVYNGSKAVIDNSVLCAGDDGKDTCQGDSGGPLMMPYGPGSNYYLYGIASHGLACGDLRYPGVLTRVSEFMGWVLLNLQ